MFKASEEDICRSFAGYRDYLHHPQDQIFSFYLQVSFSRRCVGNVFLKHLSSLSMILLEPDRVYCNNWKYCGNVSNFCE